jgi:hypothetical protein
MTQKIIGVLQTFTAPTRLDVLFFDELITLETHLYQMSGELPDDQIIADFDYLKSIGFVEEQDTTFNELLSESEQKGIEASIFAKRYADLKAWSERKPRWTRGWEPFDTRRINAILEPTRQAFRLAESGMKARLFSLARSSTAETYTPILRETKEESTATSATDLLQVIINEFPVPADNVSYEELFDFKNDSDVQRDYELFRRWLRVKFRDESSTAEGLREELKDLLSDHRAHMQLAKLKVREAKLRTLYSAPLATIERLVKLQLSTLLDPIFELRTRRMELLEAEAKSPGKEVAYLHKATERFGESEL